MDIQPAVSLAKKTVYLNKEIVYLKNVPIVEYDIKSAGFSVVRYKELLGQDMIDELERMPKEERNIKIGLFQRQFPELSSIILETLSEVRQEFVIANEVTEDDILSIKKDAIFLIKKTPKITKFREYFEFRKKSSFTSYVMLNNIEFYYSSITGELIWKGLSDDSRIQKKRKPLNIENDVVLKDIRQILKQSEKLSQEALFSALKTYRNRYLEKKLPIGSYRNLNTGAFDVRMGNRLLEVDDVDESMLEYLDISQNYINYILPLIQAVI